MEKKIHNCSKFLGLPDMTKAAIPECPPLLELDVDVEKKRELYQSVYALGRYFTWNPLKVRHAAYLALQSHGEYRAQMVREGKTPSEVLEGKTANRGGSSSVALVGHPYLLYDDYVNHRLISRLRGQGMRVLTPEMVSQTDMKQATRELAGGSYWTYEDEVIGAGGYYIKEGIVDGVISVMAFGCGPDSVMMHILDRYARRERKPYTCLTLDEHTAEAGLATRVEAFIDMVRKK
jgi:predicted nucleotide-binding protein (sugar kinase/HSP70/actin superfamily)